MYAHKMRVHIRKLLSTPLDVATFQGQQDFEVRQDFEEIWHVGLTDTLNHIL